MNNIEPMQTFKRADITGTEIDDELVFFNHITGTYYGTGSVGAEIWDTLSEPKSLIQICDHLREKYDVDEETCVAHVSKFIKDMVAGGIVIAAS